MNVTLIIILLQLVPGGIVFKITKEASVPSMEFCLEKQFEIMENSRLNPQKFIKLISVTCKERGSI